MRKINNVKNLRDELCSSLLALRSGSLESSTAKEVNNAAGKIINSCRVEMEYFRQRKETPNIPFLEANE